MIISVADSAISPRNLPVKSGRRIKIRVLQRRAADLTKLLLPFEPTELLAELAAHKAAHPDFQVEKIHFFPLGAIATTTEYLDSRRPGRVRAQA